MTPAITIENLSVTFPAITIEDSYAISTEVANRKMQLIPRNASPVRIRNRCALSGRSRAYVRRFGLSRIAFRELALEGKIPGVRKASW